MTRFLRSFLLTLALLVGGVAFSFSSALAAPVANIGINNQINYQARLMDASGFPVADGSYLIKFSLYNASAGGVTLWTATGTTGVPTELPVTVQNGLFTVLLGDTSVDGGSQNSLDSVDWNSDAIYLGVSVNGDSEMLPRKRFASVPQAFNARQLQGMYASSTALSGETLFTINQTSNDAALSDRSALDVRSMGTSNDFDYLIRGIDDSGSTVFSVNRQGNAAFASTTVGGVGVCLSDGSFCSAGAGVETDTLQTVTNRGDYTTTTLSLFGGFDAGASSVTGTFDVVGDFTVSNVSSFSGNAGFGTASPITQMHVAGKVPTGAVGSVGTGATPNSTFVVGRYVYVVDSSANLLQILDVSNSSSPISLSTTATNVFPRAVYVQGKYAYVLNQTSNTLQIFDVSNPKAPLVVGSFSTGVSPNSIYIQGRYAYITNTASNSLQIVDVSDPSAPSGLGTVATGANPRSVTVVGRYVYLLNGVASNSLQIFDAADPMNPISVGVVATNENPQSVYVQGRYAYVVNNGGFDYLQTFDVSDPTTPIGISTIATGSFPDSVYVQGRYAYVTNLLSSTLQVFDVSDPAAMLSIGAVATGANPSSVYVQGRYAYVANSTANTMQVFDMGGAYVQQLETGGIETGTLSVRNNLFGVDASFLGGVTIGQSANISGDLAVGGSIVSGGQNVCLADGTNCLPSGGGADLNWTFNFAGDFVRNATGTTDLIIGNAALNTAPFRFDTNTTSSRLIIGQTMAGQTRADVVIGATTSTGMNSLFQLTGKDLFVAGNIGSASSVYTNGAFVAGAGSTSYGDGFISKSNGSIELAASQGVTVSDRLDALYLNRWFTSPLLNNTIYGTGSSTVAVGTSPFGVAFDGSYLWVANMNSNTLSKIDVTTNAVVATVAVDWSPSGVVFDGQYIWVANSGWDSVSKIDVTTNAVVATVAVGSNPEGIAFDGQYLWVANWMSNSVSKIDVTTNAVVATVAVGSAPATLAFDGRYIWVTNVGPNNVSKIDTTTDSVVATTTVGLDPYGSAFDGRYLWVSNSVSNSVSKIDVTTNAVVATTTVGGVPRSIAFDGNNVWVVNSGTDSVSKIDAKTNAVVDTVAVGSSPRGIAFDGSHIWTTSWDNDTVTKLSIGGGNGADMMLHVNLKPDTNNIFDIGSDVLSFRNIYASGTAYLANASIAGQSVCLADGTNCLPLASTDTLQSVTNRGAYTTTTLSLFGGFVAGSSTVTGTMSIVGGLNVGTPNDASVVSSLDFGAGMELTTGKTVGNYFYGLDGDTVVLRVVDISDPRFPKAVSSLAFSGDANERGMDISGHYAYVVGSSGGSSVLNVADISNPSAPVKISSYTTSTSGYSDIDVSGRYAYIVSGGNKLEVVDVGDPSRPAPIANIALTSTSPSSVEAEGRYVYVAQSGGQIVEIFDVSKPATPVSVNTVALSGLNPTETWLLGRYLYVFSSNGFDVIDVKNPASPTAVAFYPKAGVFGGMVSGNYAYLSTGSGLSIVNVASSTNPFSIKDVSTAGLAFRAKDVFVAGHYAYMSLQGFPMSTKHFAIIDLQGADISTASIGNLSAGTLDVKQDLTVANKALLSGGLSVGSAGIVSAGSIAVSATDTASLFMGGMNVSGTINLASRTTSTALHIAVPTTNIAGVDISTGLSITDTSTSRGASLSRGSVMGDDFSALQMVDDVANSLSSTGVSMLYNHTTNNFGLYLAADGGLSGPTGNKAVMKLSNLDFGTASTRAAFDFINYSSNSSTAILSLTNEFSDKSIGQYVGGGSPEGSVYGNVGSIFFREDATASGTQAYLKTSSAGNGSIGWAGIATTDMKLPDLNWTYDSGNDFVRNATGTSDVIIGNSTVATAPFRFDTNTTSSRLIIGQTTAGQTRADVVIGATTSSGMNSLFQLTGKELYVEGNIGSASSVYTNGAFVAGAGSTYFGDGIINKNDGDLTLSASGALVVASTSTFLGNISFGTSTPIAQLYVPGKVPISVAGSVSAGTSPNGLFVQGRYSYVTDFSTKELHILDTSIPSAPVSLGAITTSWMPLDVYVQGQYAYVVTLDPSLRIFDISNPSAPSAVGSIAIPPGSTPAKVYVQGRYAYVLEQVSKTLIIYDISNPVTPVLVGSVGTSASTPQAIVVQGHYAYVVTSSSDNFLVIDVSNPSAPSVVGPVALAANPSDISVQGQYAYIVSSAGSTIESFNITNPASPTSVSTTSLVVNPSSIFVQDRYAYVTKFQNLEVVDIADPAAMTSVGVLTMASSPLSVVVEGRYAYSLVSGSGLLQTYDLGGAYIQQLEAGGIETGTLSVRNNMQAVDGSFLGGLSVAQTSNLSGGLSVAASSSSSTATFVNRSSPSSGTAWGAYIDQLSVGSSANATGTVNYSMVLTYASSSSFGGLCIDDTATGATCPVNVGASIMADGAVVSNAFDIAEMYSVTGTAEAGDVLVLDASSTATVMQSTGVAYDSKVIGIVSAAPGFLLGWSGDTKVALAGRVPVKVSMNNGPILVGDALVSSDVPGYAMKATRPGMVLGYALEASSATGTAEVFVDVGYWSGIVFDENGSIAVDDAGNIRIANDLHVGGKLFPSLKGGGLQDNWYLFVNNEDASATYMSTNADGWMSLDTYDFAERYYSPDELEPGDLVIVSDSGQTHVQRSMSEDKMLLGIVSTRPAFIAGRPATSTFAIALSGRVPTKVSNMNGAIKAGDPLVATSIPGVAAKAVHTGPIVGLALEDFENANIDKIEVFVNPGYWVNKDEIVITDSSQTVVSQTKRGFATILAGSKKVKIEFPSLGAYPNVQVTPRGSLTGSWWTENYSDTGFEIILSTVEEHDIVFAWSVEATTDSDVMRMSDGTYAPVDAVTGAPVGWTPAPVIAPTSTEAAVMDSATTTPAL